MTNFQTDTSISQGQVKHQLKFIIQKQWIWINIQLFKYVLIENMF